jgi:hypothetical protein
MFATVQLILVFLLGALIADGVLTTLILRRGGRELNPVMSLLIRRLGIGEAVLASRGAALFLVVVFWRMNIQSFLFGLLVPTLMIVFCGAYSLLRVRLTHS